MTDMWRRQRCLRAMHASKHLIRAELFARLPHELWGEAVRMIKDTRK